MLLRTIIDRWTSHNERGPMPDALAHLIYTSAAAPGFDPSSIDGILRTARKRNAELSITGMLLYIGGSFFQVLEGEEPTLLALFATISSDPRHDRVTKIIQEPISRRAFGDWTMGFSEIDPSEIEKMDGLNDFFHEGQVLESTTPGRAKKLLEAFANGRWRARLK